MKLPHAIVLAVIATTALGMDGLAATAYLIEVSNGRRLESHMT